MYRLVYIDVQLDGWTQSLQGRWHPLLHLVLTQSAAVTDFCLSTALKAHAMFHTNPLGVSDSGYSVHIFDPANGLCFKVDCIDHISFEQSHILNPSFSVLS